MKSCMGVFLCFQKIDSYVGPKESPANAVPPVYVGPKESPANAVPPVYVGPKESPANAVPP